MSTGKRLAARVAAIAVGALMLTAGGCGIVTNDDYEARLTTTGWAFCIAFVAIGVGLLLIAGWSAVRGPREPRDRRGTQR